MTGAQLLDELRNTLETNLDSLPADAAARAAPVSSRTVHSGPAGSAAFPDAARRVT